MSKAAKIAKIASNSMSIHAKAAGHMSWIET